MIRELLIWLYTRGRSLAFAVVAVVMGVAGFEDTRNKAMLISSGVTLKGEVVGLVVEPKSGEPSQTAPKPAAAEAKPTEPGKAAAPDGKEAPKQEPAACEPRVAPIIVYRDAKGTEHKLANQPYACPSPYKVGQAVEVLAAPDNPANAILKTSNPWADAVLVPIVLSLATVFMLWLAWMMKPTADKLRQALTDPGLEDERVAPSLPKSAFAGGGAAQAPLQGLVASARHIQDGLYPLELCELCAYMSALAYHESNAERLKRNKKVDDPALEMTTEAYLAVNCPHFTHIQSFANENTEGFGFVLDGAAFIIMRGTTSLADWRRNLDAAPTGARDLLPAHFPYEAPGRHRGFAEGWHVIRDQVEAWIRTTPFKDDPLFPFVFAGHSLGGALSFLGAWEFAKLERNVAAVITFGAARPGFESFADEYKALGLHHRTLRLEFTRDIVPQVQKLLGYEAVGHEWEPRKWPLASPTLALGAVPLNWMLGALQRKIIPFQDQGQAPQANPAAAGSAVTQQPAAKPGETGAEAKPQSALQAAMDGDLDKATKLMANRPQSQSKPPEATSFDLSKASWKDLRSRLRTWLLRAVIFLALSGIFALAAHNVQRRYALALSIMSYRRIRARDLAERAAQGRDEIDPSYFDRCYAALSDHLRLIRGTTPTERRNKTPFDAVVGLPRKISGPNDIKWFNTFHSARTW